MSADKYDMQVEQGATFSLAITWRDPDAVAIDLTDYTARLQARGRTGTVLVELNTDNGGITLGGAAGTIDLRCEASATTLMTAGIYHYDLELQSAGGEVTRLLQGQWIVQKEVTR